MTNPADLAWQIDGLMMRSLEASDLDALAVIWAVPNVTCLPTRGAPIPRKKAEKTLQLLRAIELFNFYALSQNQFANLNGDSAQTAAQFEMALHG